MHTLNHIMYLTLAAAFWPLIIKAAHVVHWPVIALHHQRQRSIARSQVAVISQAMAILQYHPGLSLSEPAH